MCDVLAGIVGFLRGCGLVVEEGRLGPDGVGWGWCAVVLPDRRFLGFGVVGGCLVVEKLGDWQCRFELSDSAEFERGMLLILGACDGW